MIPSEVYILVWFFDSNRSMPMLTNKGSYDAWIADPDGYSEKRMARWNTRARRQGTIAVERMEIHPYRLAR